MSSEIEKHRCRSLLMKIILLVLVVSSGVVGWIFKADVVHLWKLWSGNATPSAYEHTQFLPAQSQSMANEQHAPVQQLSFEQQRMVLTFLQLVNEQLKLELTFGSHQAYAIAMMQQFLAQTELLPKTPLSHELLERANLLHREIQALPTLDPISTQVLLNELHQTLKKIPLNLHVLTTGPTAEQNPPAPVPNTWFARFIHKISNMVIIRHHQMRPEPLLSPTEQYYLTANLQLLVTQAEIAIQTKNWTLSLEHINLIREQLEHYFDLTSLSGQQSVKLLGQLATLIESQRSENKQNALQEIVKIGELLKIISQEVDAKERAFMY